MKCMFGAVLVLSLADFMLLATALGVWTGHALVWNSNGAPISTTEGDQRNPLPASDGAGGAIISWIDGALACAAESMLNGFGRMGKWHGHRTVYLPLARRGK